MAAFRMRQVPDTRVDLLQQYTKETQKPPKKNRAGKFFIYSLILVSLFFGISKTKNVISSFSSLTDTIGQGGFLKQIYHLVASQDKALKGENEDRINLLVLGLGGVKHEGPYLTDTIILASIKPSTQELALLSIPRDLYVQIPGFGQRKINNAYAFGETRAADTGGELASHTVSQIFDLQVHYYASVDFLGVEKIVDALGGVKVYIDREFEDSQYPIENNGGVTTIHFDSGLQKLNGKEALAYARSRHGNNSEGSDFARMKRQQKLALAIKEKLEGLSVVLNGDKISKLLEILNKNVKTNMEPWEILKLAQILKNTSEAKIITRVLDEAPNGPLTIQKSIDGAFLLVPTKSDSSELKDIAKNIFAYGKRREEKAKIILQNGTRIEGLAFKTKEMLEAQGFNIIKMENAATPNFRTTILYDLTKGKKPETFKALRDKLGAQFVSYAPDSIWALRDEADFVIILGEDISTSEISNNF